VGNFELEILRFEGLEIIGEGCFEEACVESIFDSYSEGGIDFVYL